MGSNGVNLALNIATLGQYGAAKEGFKEATGQNAAREEAYKARKGAEDQMTLLTNEARDRAKKEESDAAVIAARNAARARQAAISASNSGRRGTILTGSLGLQGGDTGAVKTLLGS